MIVNEQLIGVKFGRLKIIEELEKNKRSQRRVKCICECGAEKAVLLYHLKDEA